MLRGRALWERGGTCGGVEMTTGNAFGKWCRYAVVVLLRYIATAALPLLGTKHGQDVYLAGQTLPRSLATTKECIQYCIYLCFRNPVALPRLIGANADLIVDCEDCYGFYTCCMHCST